MIQDRPYFFCGIGGSGMLPLALIVRAKGAEVAGSDRSLDQGRTTPKFDFLRERGIGLFAQDGSGVTDARQIVVRSTAVEDTVGDIVAARRVGAELLARSDLLAQLFNAAPKSVAVGGTSGKSTTTAMIAWILHDTGRDPTVMNGAVMKNFATPDAPFASALVGASDIFVSEVDESDGSIAKYNPHVAVLSNIALDHKSMEELRALFGDFLKRAAVAVLNLDNDETAALVAKTPGAITYSLSNAKAGLLGGPLTHAPQGVSFDVTEKRSGETATVKLQTPGAHNASNALAALATARALGVPLKDAAAALSRFTGVKRRLELVGQAAGVTVIDDFGHNPDKIGATLAALHQFPGRLLLMFQPHGYGPLRLMKDAFIDCFAQNMRVEDVLLMPDPVYFGGTVDRTVTSEDIAAGIRAKGREAHAFADRPTCGEKLLMLARSGDRIVIMGARDDTLSTFAAELLDKLKKAPAR
jgi:UDP-N-acetylmuramate--alanine ligase